MSPVADRLHEALGPIAAADGDNGWVLLRFCDAVTRAVADVEAFADPPLGAGWAPLFDPSTAPARALPWLGQLVGAVVAQGTAEADARAIVKAVPTWQRGTPAAVLAATKLHLIGSKTAMLTERWQGSAYRVKVTSYAAETPDVAAMAASVRASVPAGLTAVIEILAGWTVAQAETFHAARTVAQAESFYTGQSVAQVEQTVP